MYTCCPYKTKTELNGGPITCGYSIELWYHNAFLYMLIVLKQCQSGRVVFIDTPDNRYTALNFNKSIVWVWWSGIPIQSSHVLPP